MADTNAFHSMDMSKTAYANLTEAECKQLTELEKTLQKETGEKVALVAYRI